MKAYALIIVNILYFTVRVLKEFVYSTAEDFDGDFTICNSQLLYTTYEIKKLQSVVIENKILPGNNFTQYKNI